MQYQNEQEETQKKQQLLKKEIYDKGYDCQAFQDFLDQLKLNGGQDVNLWALYEIREAISVFQTTNQPVLETIELDDNLNRQSEVDDTIQQQVEIKQQIEQNDLKQEEQQQAIQQNDKQEEILAKPLIDNEKFYQKIHFCKTQDKKMILTAEEIAISIPSYERVPGGMFTSAYYSYTVITDPIDWKVQRRYSDFIWLRDILCKIYPGRNIPPLPRKTVLKNEQELYLKKRQKFLERFLQLMFKCELLRHDKWLYAFLSLKEDKDFKHIQKLSQQMCRVTKLEQLISMDGQLQLLINDNLAVYNNQATNLLNGMDICYKKLRRESKQLLLDFDQASNTIFNMGETCASLFQLSNKFNQSIPQGKISELDILYISMNNMLVQWGNNLTSQIKMVQEELGHFFKFHHHSVLALKEFIKQKDHSQSEYEKFKSRLELKKHKLFTSQDYGRWEIPSVQIKALQDSKLIQNREVCLAIMLPQETTLQEDLKNIFAYYNNQSFNETNLLLENTVKDFSKQFIGFCSQQKEIMAEQKLVWDKSIINFNNLNHPQKIINKNT